MTVLNSGGGAPVIAADGTVPAALKAAATKDAGPPAPRLDPVALEALKAQMSKSKPGSKPAPAPTAASAAVATPASASGPTPVPLADTAVGSVPLPDRKPQP
jgi:hypothetical protein